MNTNKVVANLVGGALSPLVHGRIDLPIYAKSAAKIDNFIVMTQGGARYRPGLKYAHYTRLNKKAALIPFQFSDQQAYLIEVTDKRFRFYKDNAIITEAAKTLTALTTASPGLFTSVAHGFTTGDEIYIDAVQGITALNGRSFLVVVTSVNQFTLTDIFGTAVNTTSLGAYTSGGTASRIFTLVTPYVEQDIDNLQFAQNADTMYISNQNYEPFKLIRLGHANWTINTYTRTSNPFASDTKSISAITNANPGVFTSAAHTMGNGYRINIIGATGLTALNGNSYLVANATTNTFTLTTLDGVAVDTTSLGAYVGSGLVDLLNKYPRAVAFTDTGRIVFGGTRKNPETIFGSKAPSSGTTDFDTFTTGTAATDAIVFTLVPILGKVEAIQSITNTSKALVCLTFGTLRRVYGATEQEAISPTSVTAKAVNSDGCESTLPVSNGASLFYIQQGRQSLRSMSYDISSDGYTTVDRNLVSEHLAVNGFRQIVEQKGLPDIIWAVMQDGKLTGLTYKEKEDISGWHTHYIGGRHVNTKNITMPFAKVLATGYMPRPTAQGQIWFVVERVINGNTIRSVEYMSDAPKFPLRFDFYSGQDNEAEDTVQWLNALYETQKDSVFLDMSASYDGSAYGTAAMASVTPSAVRGVGITITASAAVFTATMVGREIRKQYDINGDGGGRATITAFVDSTHVTCTTTVDFDNAGAMAAGNWFLTATSISGLQHLEGETVKIVADGGVKADQVVVNGGITLTTAATKVHVGYGYRGIIQYLNMDTGGQTGSAQAKSRNVRKFSMRFYNTLGVQFGTDPYRLDRETFRSSADITGRPTPPFTGIKEQVYSDTWDTTNKQVYLVQEEPLPATILAGDFFLKTVDSGG